MRDYAAGYAKNKSREEAILQQLCVGHRLSKAKVGHATFFKDIANAFYSPNHDVLDRAIRNTMQQQDVALLQQRHRAASIFLRAADGTVLLEPGSGGLQGDSFASDLFLEQYHPLVDGWLRDLGSDDRRSGMQVLDPVNNKVVDVSISAYADDLAIKVISQTSSELQTKATTLDDALDARLASAGLAQNRSKQEVVVHFGAVSQEHMRSTYSGQVRLEGRVLPKAKYLGEIYVHNGSTTAARKHRLQKAQAAWVSMGAFWTRPGCSRRSISIVFRALVFETA